ncbi:MAG: DUF4271 domain-containing protein [Bacteroidales bacterium]|nr:DUF4271 domain-containing protein [Candidatus Sodaliphilus aphodohippi]
MPSPVASNVLILDSARDTVAGYAPIYTDGFPQPATGDTVIASSVTQLPVMELPDGTAPVKRDSSPLHDTGTISLILFGLLAVIMCYHKGYKYIENLMHNMFSTRRRDNIFEDHTVNETSILFALIINTCICEGVIGFYALRDMVPWIAGNIFAGVGLLAGSALVFFLLQLALYNVAGYIFSDQTDTMLWTNGFKATQSMLGITLFPVVSCLLVTTEATKTLLISAAVLYLLARFIFICKGFRIFCNNFTSLLSFILYLCTVEIVPISLVCCGTVDFNTLLHL